MWSNHHSLDVLFYSRSSVYFWTFQKIKKNQKAYNYRGTIESDFLTTILKWWNSWLGWKPSELLYLSVDRISQTCLPSRYGFIPQLKEKHQVKRPQVRPQEMHDSSSVVVPWIWCPDGERSLCLSCLINWAENSPSSESRRRVTSLFNSTSAAKAIIRTSTKKNTAAVFKAAMLALLVCKSSVLKNNETHLTLRTPIRTLIINKNHKRVMLNTNNEIYIEAKYGTGWHRIIILSANRKSSAELSKCTLL